MLKGHTLITTDGTTVLGADDKAGIAEILTHAKRSGCGLTAELPSVCRGIRKGVMGHSSLISVALVLSLHIPETAAL